MKIILHFLFIISFAFAGLAQNDAYVIAATGLNVRNSPGLDGKVLFALPFESKVKIIEEKVRPDTIGKSLFPVGRYQRETDLPTGHWVKISVNDKTGYVFDGYLSDIFSEYKDENRDYAVMHLGGNCLYNLQPVKDFIWYEIVVSAGSFHLQPVTITYFYDRNAELSPLITFADKREKYATVIGSKQKNLSGITGKIREESGECSAETKQLIEASLRSPAGKAFKKNALWLADYTTGCTVADFDGDGEPDYLVNFGEETSNTVLFLSSAADGKEKVRPVALLYLGYCC